MKILVPVEDIYFGSAIANFISRHNWPAETEFKVVSVAEPWLLDSGSLFTEQGIVEAAGKEILENAQNMVDEVALYLKEAFPAAKISHYAVQGHVKHELPKLTKEWKPDLIIAGSHGRSGFNRIVLGSTSTDLLGFATCPILLVKPDETTLAIWDHADLGQLSLTDLKKHFDTPVGERQPHKVIIAVDDTDLSEELADFVQHHNWTRPASFKIVSVVQPFYWIGRVHLSSVSAIYQERLEKRRKELKEMARKLKKLLPGCRIQEELVEGDAKYAIVDKAKTWKADLVIVGSHPKNDSDTVNIGSVGLAVMCTAPCSTLLLRKQKCTHLVKDKRPLAHSTK